MHNEKYCSIRISEEPHNDLSNVPLNPFESGYIRVKNSELQLNSLFYVSRFSRYNKKMPTRTLLNHDDATLVLYDSIITSSENPTALDASDMDRIASILLAPTRDIERLVFSGGGAKGTAYTGAYDALLETGILQNVKEVSGSSAGSIAAALLSVGITPAKLDSILDTNFETLMGKRVGRLYGNPAGVMFNTKSGNELLDVIRQGIVETVQLFMSNFRRDDVLADLLPIYDKCQKTQSSVIGLPLEVTFNDLALLNQHYPGQFKKLTITGVKLAEDGKALLQIFNAKSTPDVEIALACQASCAIPVFLAPVLMKIGSRWERLVDGGVYDNIPTEYFDDVNEQGEFIPNQKKAKTLIFAFANPALHRSQHGDPAKEPCDPSWRLRLKYNIGLNHVSNIKTEWDPIDRKQEAYRRLQKDYSLRIVPLRVAPIKTKSFSLATTMSRVMHSLGYLDTQTSLTNLGLQDRNLFSPDFFYTKIVGNFVQIYSAVLIGSGKNPQHDVLLKQINTPGVGLLARYHLIRDSLVAPKVGSDKAFYASKPYSSKAFALSRAVEFYKKELSAEDLFKETYQESFKRSGFFSVSKIAGECIFKSSTLNRALEKKKMFGLFDKRSGQPLTQTRAGLVFESLTKIDEFSHDNEILHTP